MKLGKKFVAILTVFSLIMSFSAYAAEPSWETAPGKHNESILLSEDEVTASDTYYSIKRGDFLSAGALDITNGQDGSIRIRIDTYAHYGVDRIFHTVFLDQWDAEDEDWIALNYWDFSMTKDEAEDGVLNVLNTSITLTGYETNKYYRARGLHGVEYNDEIEACATETNGVLITNGPT